MPSENSPPAGTGPCDTPFLVKQSYGHIQPARKPAPHKSKDGRRRRSPMANRLGHMNKICMTTSVSYPGYVNVSIAPPTFSDDISQAAYALAPPNTFQLPPLPCASSLQLHSFVATVTTSEPAPHVLSVPDLAANMKLATRNQEISALPPVNPAGKDRVVDIPRSMHPNSPYVPWTPEIRREILRPLVEPSPVADFYACRYSRTALLPPQPSPLDAHRAQSKPKLTKLPESLKNLTFSIGRNLHQVMKRISKYKKPESSTRLFATGSLGHVGCSNSFESTDSTSLSTWLHDRKRIRLEFEKKTSLKEMTLDEYEAMGSWIQLPQPSLTNAHLLEAASDVCSGSPPQLGGWSRSLSPFSLRSLPFVEGSSRVVSSHTSHSKGTLSRRDREMSMPGGWTFE
ncbi:hypothetical protein H0H87_011020 [Tephrocybe sp. NHM501043]|nr:hypothetical protein H0H87_011020 [Tephrocybe sp. NHM501043]